LAAALSCPFGFHTWRRPRAAKRRNFGFSRIVRHVEMFGALADDIDVPAGHSNPDQSACSSKPAGESPRAFVTMRLYPASQMMTCAARTTVAAMARDCTACIRISRAVVLRFGMGTLLADGLVLLSGRTLGPQMSCRSLASWARVPSSACDSRRKFSLLILRHDGARSASDLYDGNRDLSGEACRTPRRCRSDGTRQQARATSRPIIGGNLAARLGRVLYWVGCLAATGWCLLPLASYLSSTGPMPRGFWAIMIATGVGIWAVGWGLRYILSGER
jgi:hypothetical protein